MPGRRKRHTPRVSPYVTHRLLALKQHQPAMYRVLVRLIAGAYQDLVPKGGR